MRSGPISKRPSFRSAFGFGGLSFAVSGILALGSSIFTARIYGIDVIGEFALAYAPTGAVWFLSSVREQPALIRLLAPLPPRSPRVTGLFVPVFIFSEALTLVSSIVAAVATYLLFRGPIGHPDLFAPAMVSLGGYLLFTNPAWNIDGVLSAFRAGRDLFWIRSHQMAAYLVFAVAASFFMPTVWGLILSTVASWVTSLAHRLYVSPKWMRWSVPVGGDPQRIPRAAAHPAIRAQGDTGLARHRSERSDRDVDPRRLRLDQRRRRVEPRLGAESALRRAQPPDNRDGVPDAGRATRG